MCAEGGREHQKGQRSRLKWSSSASVLKICSFSSLRGSATLTVAKKDFAPIGCQTLRQSLLSRNILKLRQRYQELKAMWEPQSCLHTGLLLLLCVVAANLCAPCHTKRRVSQIHPVWFQFVSVHLRNRVPRQKLALDILYSERFGMFYSHNPSTGALTKSCMSRLLSQVKSAHGENFPRFWHRNIINHSAPVKTNEEREQQVK